MAAAGWTRTDPRPWGKCNALAGVQDGFPADHGHAWDTIGDVIAWVASAPARAFEVQP